MLYGVNTLGAVCGAYFATFFALEFLGTRATLWFGCAMNLLVGVIAMSLSRRCRRWMRQMRRRWRAAVDRRRPRESESSSGCVYVTAAVLGFTFFTLELVWYRMLAPILGGTTFTFGLILCVALLGIGIGGACLPLGVSLGAAELVGAGAHCAAEAALAALPLALGDRLALFAGRWFMHSTTFCQVRGGLVHRDGDRGAAGGAGERAAVSAVGGAVGAGQGGGEPAIGDGVCLEHAGRDRRFAGGRVRRAAAADGAGHVAGGGR